jgi:hypothetical protein
VSDHGQTDLNIFWGDSHHNIFVRDSDVVDMDQVCRSARAHLDFMTMAYYTPRLFAYKAELNPPGKRGFRLEEWKQAERIEREWRSVQEASRGYNNDGMFVTFPGYEWQGDGASGDHNIVYREEGPPVYRVGTLTELYECLRTHAAIAIPHHTAYRIGCRGKDWSVHDEDLSPFAELYSVHGCSEADENWVGMWRNHHMGPNIAGGTYRDALLRGLHIGAICSGDNFGHEMLTGTYGNGLMAVLAPELTREALWEAFAARRVYGVTGDRIELGFTINGEPMGARIAANGPRRICVAVKGLDAIDRIEVLRDERVIATHNHQGTWECPRPGARSRFIVRLEAGWGPTADELEVGDQAWTGVIALTDGRFIRAVPCWCTHGQEPVKLAGNTATFTMCSSPRGVANQWQNANVFEFEADPASVLRLRLNGREESATISELMNGSRVIWYREECVRLLQQLRGLTPEECTREDTYYHMAYKAKLHRAMPEAAYAATYELEDGEPLVHETCYRVRVEQRNGQRAWSSPIWVR